MSKPSDAEKLTAMERQRKLAKPHAVASLASTLDQAVAADSHATVSLTCTSIIRALVTGDLDPEIAQAALPFAQLLMTSKTAEVALRTSSGEGDNPEARAERKLRELKPAQRPKTNPYMLPELTPEIDTTGDRNEVVLVVSPEKS